MTRASGAPSLHPPAEEEEEEEDEEGGDGGRGAEMLCEGARC